MSTLIRASEIAQKVVVTYAGEDIAQIKDIVYAANGGEIGSFTLAGRGLFAGPLKVALPWSAVVGLGPDAVIIESEAVLVPLAEAFQPGETSSGKADILKSEVLTDAGTSLGRVSDVIIGIGATQGGQADVVGYQIDPAESLGRGKTPTVDSVARHVVRLRRAPDGAGLGGQLSDRQSGRIRLGHRRIPFSVGWGFLMLFTEATGQKVVSTGNASTVGHIGSLVVDPISKKVVGLSLKKTPGTGTMLPWTGITAFGVDAVTVSSEEQIVVEDGDLAELNSKAHTMIKKRILTTEGQQIGTVRDVDFDPADGTILGILTDDQPIAGAALLGVGSYAVVVKV